MKPVKPEEWRITPHNDAFGRSTMAPLREAAPRVAGILRRVFAALVHARQRQAEREIARHFLALGGRMTDENERKLMERILSGKLF